MQYWACSRPKVRAGVIVIQLPKGRGCILCDGEVISAGLFSYFIQLPLITESNLRGFSCRLYFCRNTYCYCKRIIIISSFHWNYIYSGFQWSCLIGQIKLIGVRILKRQGLLPVDLKDVLIQYIMIKNIYLFMYTFTNVTKTKLPRYSARGGTQSPWLHRTCELCVNDTPWESGLVQQGSPWSSP